MESESKGMIFGILGVVAFSLTLPATRYIVPYFEPVFIALGRAVIAALFAALILFISRSPLPSRTQFKKLIVISLGVVIGFPIFSAWSMQTLPASHGGVVLGILPLATAVAGVFVSKDRPSIGFWLFGIIGALLVVSYSLLGNNGSLAAGDVMLLLAIVSAAAGYAVGGQLSREMGGWRVICWALVIATPFILVPAWFSTPVDVESIPTSAFISFLYLALVSQLTGFFLWYHGLALGGVARVSQTQLLQPFITIAASAWLLQESINFSTLIFATLVVLIVLVGKRQPIYNNSLR